MSKFETGEENAMRFVRAVTGVAQENRHVCMVMEPLANSERGGWIWMQNKEWRARVMELLAGVPVKFATFHKPDHLGEWTFSGLSIAPQHKIEQLALNDTLIGPPPSSRTAYVIQATKSWRLPVFWWALGIGLLATALYAGVH